MEEWLKELSQKLKMKEVKTKARNLPITPRKLRLVVKMVRGRTPKDLLEYLPLIPKKGAKIFYKVLKTALADAEHNFSLTKDKLRFKEVRVDEGVVMKRWRPVSRGRAHTYKRRRSHLTIVLEEVK